MCQRDHNLSNCVLIRARRLADSTKYCSTDASKAWVYRFLNEDGVEQMGGLAIVFLSSWHKQKNNKTAGL